MKRVLKVGGIGLLLMLIAGAVFLVPTLWFKPWRIDHFYIRTFAQFALKRPEMLSQIRILEPMGFHFHADDLNNYSMDFVHREAQVLNKELRVLQSYNRRGMSEQDRLSAEVLEWFMRNAQDSQRFMFHDYMVTQLEGVQSALPDFMVNIHEVSNRRDAENYIGRVSKFGVAFDQVLEGLRWREENGIVPPRIILKKTLEASRGIENALPRENVLYQDLDKKLQEVGRLDPAGREEILGRLEREIRDIVLPAYARLNAYLTELETRATDEAGVWKLPNGEAYYEHQLQSHTTTQLSADSIHVLGLHEVARIKDQMREILQGLGLSDRDPVATLRRLAERPEFRYAESENARQQILADYQAMIDDALKRSKPLFNRMPNSSIEVRPVPDFLQATAPGGYYIPPAFDGSRPGVFYANLRDPAETIRYDMRTLAYHEAIPGHHFQIAIQQELKGVPFFRKLLPFSAYMEGWGLYAERLALEHGYHPDPYDQLGALKAELFRAARLVVDTGIHRKRWTREQAIDYMLANTGSAEPSIVTEVERYMVWPGQACAYKVGQLKILELRERARRQLGERFDLAEFHDVVLSNGALPLEVLAQVVDRWLDRKHGERPRETEG